MIKKATSGGRNHLVHKLEQALRSVNITTLSLEPEPTPRPRSRDINALTLDDLSSVVQRLEKDIEQCLESLGERLQVSTPDRGFKP